MNKKIGEVQYMIEGVIFYLDSIYLSRDYQNKGLSKIILNSILSNYNITTIEVDAISIQSLKMLISMFGNPKSISNRFISDTISVNSGDFITTCKQYLPMEVQIGSDGNFHHSNWIKLIFNINENKT